MDQTFWSFFWVGITFALYVAFFPQLVAGPIVRAASLVPQLDRRPRYAPGQIADGAGLFTLGLFKKVVIADALAPIVERVYAAPGQFGGADVLLATYAFAFQIYCDFSGYTDIARGVARMLGFFFPPDVEYGRETVVPAILESIQIAWFGTLVGAVLSLPLGLMAAGDGGSENLLRGVEFLLSRQQDHGGWTDEAWTGTGFPKVFYLDYHLYATYFPLWALATYRQIAEAGGDMPRVEHSAAVGVM